MVDFLCGFLSNIDCGDILIRRAGKTMTDYIDAHTHIHMTAAESRGFLERLHYPVRFQGTVDESLPIMDRAGIRTTMIVPWIPARQLLEEASGERGQARPRNAAAGTRRTMVHVQSMGGANLAAIGRPLHYLGCR